ncbi:MBL fold metallo-hydrolase [Candidatus Bealeia paramacronuclearis]|uniref:MBL fold metallo-hydrolase n=1 Tax=Candidatus Bealeia paramacronuclearis TaxID=1921001 RepID=A0ABZ2C3G5_9PROT|nr:MBL fold metallo-hydrolase [Candidatus Bealeia paramacronuclearis]
MIFRQLFDLKSSTYTYILGDEETRDSISIDPVRSQIERDLKLLQELNLTLKFILETHVHADHVTSASHLRDRTGAKTVYGSKTNLKCADILIEDGENLECGNIKITALHTPGHTNGCTSYWVDNKVFTGDALMIRACGRTDFQEGSNEKLFKSVREKLFALPDETLVYTAHDYLGRMVSTIGEEKKFNPRLGLSQTLEDFIAFMEEHRLPYPKMMDIAVPLNQSCGKMEKEEFEITPDELVPETGNVILVDVRGAEELKGPSGYIEGIVLATLGEDLNSFLESANPEAPYVFICERGRRSALALFEARARGFQDVKSLQGGMLYWRACGK